MPPIIHVALLSNLAWLKRPAAAPNLKIHELVALCSAAVRPSSALWQAFTRHLRSLETLGTLNSDQAAAIVASELTESLLLDLQEELPDEDDVDASTLHEVVERVREDFESKARAQALAEIETIRTQAGAEIQVAHEKTADAQAQAGDEAERHRQLSLKVDGLNRKIASWIAWFVFIAIFAVLTIGAVVAATQFQPVGKFGRLVVWGSGVSVAAIGLALTVFGGSVKDWRIQLREWIYRKLSRHFGIGSGDQHPTAEKSPDVNRSTA